MLFAIILLALGLTADVAADEMTVQVGGATSSGSLFQFITPRIINARPGDVITFQFKPGNHSVTQSSFDSPCTPLSGGFDSGWVFIPPDKNSSAPTFSLIITDIHPIYFYCKQLSPTPHCIQGMVGAINIQSLTFDHFQMTAEEFEGTPGQKQGGLVGVGAKASTGIVGVPSGATVYPISSSVTSGSPSGTAIGDLPTISATSRGGTGGPIPSLGGSVSASRATPTTDVALSAASNASYSTTILGSSPEGPTTAANNTPTVTAGAVSKSKLRVGEIAGVILGALAIVAWAIFLFLRSCNLTRNSTLKAKENEVALAESPSRPYVIHPFIIPPTTRPPGPLPQKFAVLQSSQNNQIGTTIADSFPVAREPAQSQAHTYHLHSERENISHEPTENFQSDIHQTHIRQPGEQQQHQYLELLDLPPLYDSFSTDSRPQRVTCRGFPFSGVLNRA